MPQPLYSRKGDLEPTVQEAGRAPGLVWMGAEYLAPSGFDPQTVQCVESCYNNYGIPAHFVTNSSVYLTSDSIFTYNDLLPDLYNYNLYHYPGFKQMLVRSRSESWFLIASHLIGS